MFIFRKWPTFFTINKYLATVNDCNNNNGCLQQCFSILGMFLSIEVLI